MTEAIISVSGVSDDSDPALVWEGVVQQAVATRVSDIHVLAQSEAYNLYFRLDGEMRRQGNLPHAFCRRLISHVKASSGMDVAETRRPVEGHIRLKANEKTIDLRISTIPSLHGQDMVVRLFDKTVSLLNLDKLGMLKEQLAHIRDVLSRPYGLLLVTGPSGSGKTTTLYAMLRYLVGNTRKIITIEDPVEYDLEGVNQTQVKPRIGVNFATMLTAIMRQDPDIVMVGEIRDQETAVTAIRAANTGHLVLATTHATRPTRAIETLTSLGVHPYFFASCLRAVLAQVLVKRICQNCRKPLPETADMLGEPEVLRRLDKGVKPCLYLGEGCKQCHGTGYLGRMALFESFIPSEQAKQTIIEGRSTTEIEKLTDAKGHLSLEQTAKLAALTGQTTMEEIVRVLPTL